MVDLYSVKTELIHVSAPEMTKRYHHSFKTHSDDLTLCAVCLKLPVK